MTHRTAALVALVGGAMMAVGSLLPWMTARSGFGTIEVSGLDGDGIITLVAGAVVALVAFVSLDRPTGMPGKLVIQALGAIGFLVAVMDGMAANDRIAEMTSEVVVASIGAGLYVVGLGGVAAVLGGATMQRSVPAAA